MSVCLSNIFKEKILRNEMKIYCDGIAWNEHNSPSVCQELLFQNSNGKVHLKSFYQIESIDIQKLIKIDYLSVVFDPMIKQIDKFSFNKPEIKIEFTTNEDFTEKFNAIKEKFDLLEISYPQKDKILIVLNDYKDINLLEMSGINEDNEMEINEYKDKLFAISEKDQIFKDDNIEIDEDEEKKDEPQFTIETDFIKFNSNDVEKEFNDFYNSREGLININEIPERDEDYRENEQYSFAHKISLNYNNNFCQIIPNCSINYNNKNNFNFMIKENNLMINQDLIYLDNTELVEEYKQITIYNYLNIYKGLFASTKDKKNINYIDFFASLLTKYLGDLENKKQEINKRLVSINKNTSQMYNPLNNFALRLSYEIQTLKLLYILFLDCYKITIDQKTEIQNEDTNIFLRELKRINKMRKKKIIEWLIETAKDIYERKKKKENNQLKQLILAITSGQLQDAILISQNMNMPMLALLISQTNNKNKQSYMAKIMNYLYASQLKMKEEVKKIYNLFGNVDNCIIATEDLTWYQYFIQILVFSNDPKETLNNELKELDNILRQNGLLPNNNNDFSEIDDINYCLLMLFQSIEDMNKESNISTQLYKCISSCTFKFKCMENCRHKNHNSDHHLLFIISDILLKLLKSDAIKNDSIRQSKSSQGSNYNESMECDKSCNKFEVYDIKTLSKLNQMMINKVLQEMMINKTTNLNFIPHIFNLINFSFYNEYTKSLLKKDIISKLGYDISQIKDLNMLLQSNNISKEFKIDQSIISYALGLYNKSIFNYTDSIKYFQNSGDFGMILDTFTMENINLFVENQGKIKYTDEFLDKFREIIIKYKGENYINGISSLFYKFCCYMNDLNNCDLKNLNDLLDKVIDIKSQEKLIKLAKGYMIECIRDMINLKLKLDNYKCSGSSDRLLLPLPSMKILGNPNVRLGYKKMEIENGINVAIKVKSEKYKI